MLTLSAAPPALTLTAAAGEATVGSPEAAASAPIIAQTAVAAEGAATADAIF